MRRFFRRAAEEFGKHSGAFVHTAERAAQRAGVTIEPSDYRKAVRAIASGQVPLRKHVGGNRFEVRIKLKGREVRAVYDVETQRIITALPR